jgi:SPP1 family predicted phage head-tail adaptor
MQAGHLRHQIIIQAATTAQDAYGEPVRTWTTHATVRAAVEPLQGREYFVGQQMQSEVSTRIRIRYRTGITPLMRVLWGSRIFEIETVQEVKSNRQELHLMCRENQDG